MSDAYSAADIAAILENFREQERAAAVFESRRQKVVFERNLGVSGHLVARATLEAVIDQSSTSDEIYQMVARFDEAIDRHKAKVELGEHYGTIDQLIRQLSLAVAASATREVNFLAENAAASIGRREIIPLSSTQRATLDNDDKAIKRCRSELIEEWKLVEAAKKRMNASNPYDEFERDLHEREVAVVSAV